MKRILALDFGDKRVGVAISSLNCEIAHPFGTLSGATSRELAGKIKQIVEKENIKKIVIGLPLNLKGQAGFRADITKKFAKELQSFVNLPIIFQDERFTSKEAARILNEQGVKCKKAKIDALSAVLILQQYLEKENAKE